MLYDCFCFFNELDLLEIRLNELDAVVDTFVLVEAELTHNGDPKPLYFESNKNRFDKFLYKIVHIVVRKEEFAPAMAGQTFQEQAWMRENIQRNAIAKGLKNAQDDDLIMVSDLDEIPRATVVATAKEAIKDGEVVGLILNAYNFYANLRNASAPYWGNDPKMATIRTFKDEKSYASSLYNHFILREINTGPTATRFRYIKPSRRLENAGWHFSYLGGIDAAVAKVKAFNEVGLYGRDDLHKHVEKCITSGKALFGGDRFLPEIVDDGYPRFLLDNIDRFGHLFVPCPENKRMMLRCLFVWYKYMGICRRLVMRVLFCLTPKWVRILIKRMLGYNF